MNVKCPRRYSIPWTLSGNVASPSRHKASRWIIQAQDGKVYHLNFIDTPGHVDFSYEVSRSLAACEGALLVVDAAQGVEAQSVANCYTAVELGLEVIPVAEQGRSAIGGARKGSNRKSKILSVLKPRMRWRSAPRPDTVSSRFWSGWFDRYSPTRRRSGRTAESAYH